MVSDRNLTYVLIGSLVLLAVSGTVETMEDGLGLMTVNYVLFGAIIAFTLYICIYDLDNSEWKEKYMRQKWARQDAEKERDTFKWMLEQLGDSVPVRFEIVDGQIQMVEVASKPEGDSTGN